MKKTLEDYESHIQGMNYFYRLGEPIAEDFEYDMIVEEYKKLALDECEGERAIEFLKKQNEGNLNTDSTITLESVAGSLHKLKSDDCDSLSNFIHENINCEIFATLKLDGISCVLKYDKYGYLEYASTRGDGYVGQNITAKANVIEDIKNKIENDIRKPLLIRGELVMSYNNFDRMNKIYKGKFAHPRNVVAGLFNRKEIIPSDLGFVSFVPYEIFVVDSNEQFTKEKAIVKLGEFGFKKINQFRIDKTGLDTKSISQKLTEIIEKYNCDFENESRYPIDGLVISSPKANSHCDEYYPEHTMAFKINQLTAIGKIVDIDFDGPSKNGKFTPIGIIDPPVVLGNANISRVTLYNIDYLKEMCIAPNTNVCIVKSGDIIPKVVSVIDRPENCDEWLNQFETGNIEMLCPVCGTKLTMDYNNVNLCCPNKITCSGQIVEQIYQFIRNLGIDGVNVSSIESMGISSFDDLIRFTPNMNYKRQIKFHKDLKKKLTKSSTYDLLTNGIPFDGLATKFLTKLVEYYGFENCMNCNFDNHLAIYPSGIGDMLAKRFREQLPNVLSVLKKFIDSGLIGNTEKIVIDKKEVDTNTTNICITGEVDGMGRTQLAKVLEKNGIMNHSTVSKKLDYLVLGDSYSNTSSKKVKAEKLGIKIIGIRDFLKERNLNLTNGELKDSDMCDISEL